MVFVRSEQGVFVKGSDGYYVELKLKKFMIERYH